MVALVLALASRLGLLVSLPLLLLATVSVMTTGRRVVSGLGPAGVVRVRGVSMVGATAPAAATAAASLMVMVVRWRWMKRVVLAVVVNAIVSLRLFIRLGRRRWRCGFLARRFLVRMDEVGDVVVAGFLAVLGGLGWRG